MKFLKLLLFLVLIVLIGGAIFFSVKDGTYDISDTTEITAPNELVFNTINDYKSWEHWGPWKKEDSTMVFSYPEKTSGIGGSYSWTGMMDGSMTTTALEENKSIHQDLTLVTPAGERYPKVKWEFQPTANGGTQVTWGMTGEHTLMDKMYYTFSGTDFEADMHKMNNEGFDGLKAMLKKEMEKFDVKVNGITEHGGGFYLYKTSSSNGSNISQTMGQNYGEIMGFMSANSIQQTGMPFTIYNEMNADGSVIMTNAIPVKNKVVVTGNSNVLCKYMPPSKVLLTTLKGNYTNLGAAWGTAMEYMASNNLQQSDQKPFEIYTNDPGNFPNPADWTTEVYIPIIKADSN